MILPHSKHVSMRLVSWIPTVDEMADATAAMLAAHGYNRASVVAHSYGTMVASRLVMKYPQLVHCMCLTDPVGG
jgi:pimeloyl-ACP methyl ester carboxylesterase